MCLYPIQRLYYSLINGQVQFDNQLSFNLVKNSFYEVKFSFLFFSSLICFHLTQGCHLWSLILRFSCFSGCCQTQDPDQGRSKADSHGLAALLARALGLLPRLLLTQDSFQRLRQNRLQIGPDKVPLHPRMAGYGG